MSIYISLKIKITKVKNILRLNLTRVILNYLEERKITYEREYFCRGVFT